jgi:hypothetical protein
MAAPSFAHFAKGGIPQLKTSLDFDSSQRTTTADTTVEERRFSAA